MVSVTILLSSYNHQVFIDEAIVSVINQSYQDWELWVLDDASTDGTIEKLKIWEAKDQRINLFLSKANLGKARQLNKVLNKISTPYTAFLDSDDHWHPEKLQQQINVLEKNEGIGLVFTDGYVVDSRPLVVKQKDKAWKNDLHDKRFSEAHRTPPLQHGNMFTALLHGNFIFYSSVLFRSKYLEEVAFQTEINRSMDWLFWIEMAQQTKFWYIKEPLAYYRVHGKNLQNKVNTSDSKYAASLFVMETYGKHIESATKHKYLYIAGLDNWKNNRFELAKKQLREALRYRSNHWKSWVLLLAASLHIKF